ncbi:hypothetical protein HOY80DRAFT_964174 [Tuber brumale]|nr:hypothetical protein HOY80DRAFT_964174 [Tuber brumale]
MRTAVFRVVFVGSLARRLAASAMPVWGWLASPQELVRGGGMIAIRVPPGSKTFPHIRGTQLNLHQASRPR